MKTVRTVTQTVEANETIRQEPKFKVGDYMEIYCGWNEGHCFRIEDMRFNHDHRTFEYLYGNVIMGGWHAENALVRRKEAA
ncbi:hypothetical protein QBK99_12610 [Corticibacterium sp. UT-5YL-CI-8]|nr:hypothetical protein [Tianweitania sp. UT-5YL-CI-8]